MVPLIRTLPDESGDAPAPVELNGYADADGGTYALGDGGIDVDVGDGDGTAGGGTGDDDGLTGRRSAAGAGGAYVAGVGEDVLGGELDPAEGSR